MKKAYSTEEADLHADAAAVQSLWCHNLMGYDALRAAEKFRAGYVENPAGRGMVFALRSKGEGQPQGTLGLYPRSFYLGARALRAVSMADFAVNREHRSVQPALMLMRHAALIAAQTFELIYGSPNPRASPIFAMASFKRIGDVHRYAKPLASAGHLSRHVPAWAARLSAPVADLALQAMDRIRELRSGSRLVCRPANWDDSAIDEIWARRPPSTLLSERTARMLSWRFGAPRHSAWQFNLAFDSDSVARGYIVWRNIEGFVEIGDFFTDTPETRTSLLIVSFTRWIRRKGARSISLEFFGSSAVAQQLKSAGMHLRPERAPVFVGSNTPTLLEEAENWFLTLFDSDAD